MSKGLRHWLTAGALLFALFAAVVLDGIYGKGVLLETLREVASYTPWR